MEANRYLKKKRKTKVTKEYVFNAAIQVMEKKGAENTTIRDICKRADISIGTFYNYFKTKNDIFYEIYKSADELFLNTVKKLLKDGTAEEKIISYFRHYAKLNIDTGLEEAKLLYNPTNQWFLKRRAMQEILSDIIKQGQDDGELTTRMTADEMVEFLFVLMRGVCYNWCISNGNYDLEEKMISYLKEILLSLKR